MSDEVIVMDKARIQQAAEPVSAYRNPANPFVAGFIGVTNFLAGTVEAVADGTLRLRCGILALQGRAAGAGPALVVGNRGVAAIRAEQIRLSAGPNELARLDTVLSATVRDVIFEGERIVYTVEAHGLDGPALRVFDHDPADHEEHRIGAAVHLGWNVRDLLIYPN